MQLKKWGMIGLCMLMVAGSVGCTPKETETVKTEIEEAQKEQPEEQLSREIKPSEPEWRGYSNDEVVELYPELKEVKAYLLETYADVLVAEKPQMEDAREIVGFGYWGGGGGIPHMGISVNFKETATKEQMIEACSYGIEQLRKIFPPEKQTWFEVTAFTAYTSDGKPREVSGALGAKATLLLNSEGIKWEVKQAPDFQWTEVTDPYADPAPAEQPPAEQPPTEVAANEIPLSKVTGTLSEIGFEIADSTETSNGYVLSGKDSEGFSNYMITTDKNKNLRGMTCTISEAGQPLTGADFLTKAMTYMGVCVTIPYEEEETSKKALRFVLDNMDAGMLTLTSEEQKITIGDWDISISYVEKSKTYMLYYDKVK